MIFILCILIALVLLCIYDVFFNKKHTIKSNFPIVGRIRYFLESKGPEIRQYLVANNREEKPFSRVQRFYIYASAKGQNSLKGFGTDADINEDKHFFIKPSMFPTRPLDKINFDSEVIPCAKLIGGKREKPYRPKSIVNISAMSYGSLGKRATEANNKGAAIAGAYHNTGEGGFSKYHDHGADVVFHIGTGYFGCGYTDSNGVRKFSLEKLIELTNRYPSIKMIELKLSQGAKPGKGGILPKEKITKEISEIRGIEMGKDVYSPAHHDAFSDVDEMIDFIEEIAEATGLPVGIKSAVGNIGGWYEIARSVGEDGRGPDFISIDGGEGGTGAAPPSFADNVSLPLDEAFASVYKVFQEFKAEGKVAFIASGKLGFPANAVKAFAMGADLINVAREIMISAGCIQAQSCQNNNCPAGIATHKKWLERGFDIDDKSKRVGRFIKKLNKDILQITHAAGYSHPCEFGSEDVTVNVKNSNVSEEISNIFEYDKTDVHFKK